MFLSFAEIFNKIYPYIIEGFLLFIVFICVFKFANKNRRALNILIIYLVLLAILYLVDYLNYELAYKVYRYICYIYPILAVVVLVPDIRRQMESRHRMELKYNEVITSSDQTKREIAEAVFELSHKKIGALITVENAISLDQYAQKAIILDSEISKELLINIFIPNTPLHDGAVIIRGNRIRCAAAYYILTQNEDLDKTTGSRHRAGMGISEVTDALTIICSEETGRVSVTFNGTRFTVDNEEKLLEYLDSYVK